MHYNDQIQSMRDEDERLQRVTIDREKAEIIKSDDVLREAVLYLLSQDKGVGITLRSKARAYIEVLRAEAS